MRDDSLLLGLDTGGTYTDAVLFSHGSGVLAKAKSLTTRHNLSIGIAGAISAVLETSGIAPDAVEMVSLSTTLATNALVEGKVGRAALVLIGFGEAELQRAGLRDALGGDALVMLPGGHDTQGKAKPLDLEPLRDFLASEGVGLEGFAVAGMFATRNPEHERAARELILQEAGRSVTTSHELSAKLGGPKRALTTLLNARLVPVIAELISACRVELDDRHITAPLMVVRGDGTLVSADFARTRPIETILSGPAASIIGARRLCGAQNAIISDIGGTTTDVAILEKGWPRLNPDGATVGGYNTMVEAVAMHTFGLGGDSIVLMGDDGLILGPRRQVPVSLLAMDYPDLVIGALKQQLQNERLSGQPAKFAWRVHMDQTSEGLKPNELKLLDRMSASPVALSGFLKGASEASTLERLVARNMVQTAGFTPSDAMHVLGNYSDWNLEAAQLAADLIARSKDRFGETLAHDGAAFSKAVFDALIKMSGDCILKTCFRTQEETDPQIALAFTNRALEGEGSIVSFRPELDRPVIGLGASAAAYYPAVGQRLGAQISVPDHANVANAVGAVAAEIRIVSTLEVSSPDGGKSFSFRTHDGEERRFNEEKKALETAQEMAESIARSKAKQAGAGNVAVENSIEVNAPHIEDMRYFINATLTSVAMGRPRVRTF